MANEADQAQKVIEDHEQRSIEHHRQLAQKRELEPKGHCRWCYEPFEEGSQRLFFPGDSCAEDWE